MKVPRASALLVLGASLGALWLGCAADGTGGATGDDSIDAGGGGQKDQWSPADLDGGVVFLDAGLGGGEDGGNAGTDGGGGSDAGGGVPGCVDTPGIGSTDATAKALGTIDDCDGSGSQLSGTINGVIDTDVFSLGGTDTSLCVINPTMATSTADIELCMFASCKVGTMSFTGCETSSPATDGAFYGCCITAPGQLVIDYSCSTSDDSVNTFIRVRSPKNVCIPYTASYHF